MLTGRAIREQNLLKSSRRNPPQKKVPLPSLPAPGTCQEKPKTRTSSITVTFDEPRISKEMERLKAMSTQPTATVEQQRTRIQRLMDNLNKATSVAERNKATTPESPQVCESQPTLRDGYMDRWVLNKDMFQRLDVTSPHASHYSGPRCRKEKPSVSTFVTSNSESSDSKIIVRTECEEVGIGLFDNILATTDDSASSVNSHFSRLRRRKAQPIPSSSESTIVPSESESTESNATVQPECESIRIGQLKNIVATADDRSSSVDGNNSTSNHFQLEPWYPDLTNVPQTFDFSLQDSYSSSRSFVTNSDNIESTENQSSLGNKEEEAEQCDSSSDSIDVVGSLNVDDDPITLHRSNGTNHRPATNDNLHCQMPSTSTGERSNMNICRIVLSDENSDDESHSMPQFVGSVPKEAVEKEDDVNNGKSCKSTIDLVSDVDNHDDSQSTVSSIMAPAGTKKLKRTIAASDSESTTSPLNNRLKDIRDKNAPKRQKAIPWSEQESKRFFKFVMQHLQENLRTPQSLAWLTYQRLYGTSRSIFSLYGHLNNYVRDNDALHRFGLSDSDIVKLQKYY